jgi:tetratricopeptide (TPR) repeat protein
MTRATRFRNRVASTQAGCPASRFQSPGGGEIVSLPIRLLALVLLVLSVALVDGCANGPPPTETELGEQALDRGDWRAARIHFAIALRIEPRDGRAWLGQARAQNAGREPEAALASLKSLTRADPALFQGAEGRATYADALHGAAVERLARKQPKQALAAARALAKLDPERRGLNRLLGDVALAEAGRLRLRGDRNGAFALYQEASRIVPQRLEGWLGAAEIMIEANQGKSAVRYLEAARQYHPTSGEIRMLSIQAISAR